MSLLLLYPSGASAPAPPIPALFLADATFGQDVTVADVAFGQDVTVADVTFGIAIYLDGDLP